jgi:hypothetical protein
MRLFAVDPPIPITEYDFESDDCEKVVTGHTDYVAVSAANVPCSGPETYIFRANEDGEVEDWGELEGSYRGGLSHETALGNAGYSIGTKKEEE